MRFNRSASPPARSLMAVLAALVFVSAAVARGDRPELLWNGEPVKTGAALAFLPGRMHTVEVRGGGAGELEVVRLPPGGGASVERAKLQNGAARIDVGPLTSPALYEFAAGEVFRYGYRLRIVLRRSAGGELRWEYGQGLADPESERLLPGKSARVSYAAGWGWQSSADFRLEEARRMRPVLDLRLGPEVLSDPDRLTVHYSSLSAEPLKAVMTITAEDGRTLFEREVTAGSGEIGVDGASSWPEGDYRVSLWPKIGGYTWHEGPEVVYRRRPRDPAAVRISPLVPWKLERDPTREEIALPDMRKAVAGYGDDPINEDFWSFNKQGDLLSRGIAEGDAVALDPGLTGWYAVFVTPVGRTMLRAGEADMKRVVTGTGGSPFAEAFLTAADMSGGKLHIYPLQRDTSGVAALRLVPVTESSAQAFFELAGRPPRPLFGSNDWTEYFHAINEVGNWSPATDDQLPVILAGQAEKGIRDIGWAIGRSVLTYRSELEHATLHTRPGIGEMLKRLDPLAVVLDSAPRSGSRIWAFLAMNRHYVRPPHSSRFYLDNPQWRHIHKDGAEVRHGRMSYYFPEVRRERLDIFMEVARRGVHGLQVCTVRQVPMMSYHPAMVREYRRLTGVDPHSIDAAAGRVYEDWIRWRAGFFTQFLRRLRAELRPLERERGEPIEVAVRLPSAGLFWNLAQGLDVEAWLRDGLVDRLLLHPLDDRHGRGSHDVRPYVALGRQHGVEVFGGMGATAFLWGAHRRRGEQDIGHTAALRRALGLLRAGVDGIEIYEAELLAPSSPHAWLARLWGDAASLERFLVESNIESCFPVNSMNACRGVDNHSFRGSYGWDVEGFGRYSL